MFQIDDKCKLTAEKQKTRIRQYEMGFRTQDLSSNDRLLYITKTHINTLIKMHCFRNGGSGIFVAKWKRYAIICKKKCVVTIPIQTNDYDFDRKKI